MNIEPTLDSIVDIKLAEAQLALAKSRLAWNAAREFYLPVVNAFQRMGCEPYLSGDDLAINCTGDKDTLLKAITILRTAGLDFTTDPPKPGDSSWYAFFRSPAVALRVWFNFTSSVCRRVQVGTETREVPIYETQCGNMCDFSLDDPALQGPTPAPVLRDLDLEEATPS